MVADAGPAAFTTGDAGGHAGVSRAFRDANPLDQSFCWIGVALATALGTAVAAALQERRAFREADLLAHRRIVDVHGLLDRGDCDAGFARGRAGRRADYGLAF